MKPSTTHLFLKSAKMFLKSAEMYLQKSPGQDALGWPLATTGSCFGLELEGLEYKYASGDDNRGIFECHATD